MGGAREANPLGGSTKVGLIWLLSHSTRARDRNLIDNTALLRSDSSSESLTLGDDDAGARNRSLSSPSCSSSLRSVIILMLSVAETSRQQTALQSEIVRRIEQAPRRIVRVVERFGQDLIAPRSDVSLTTADRLARLGLGCWDEEGGALTGAKLGDSLVDRVADIVGPDRRLCARSWSAIQCGEEERAS